MRKKSFKCGVLSCGGFEMRGTIEFLKDFRDLRATVGSLLESMGLFEVLS